MRNAFLAGASAFALVLGGCSMFQSGDASAQKPASQPTPALSGSSQAPSQAQNQTPHDATTDQSTAKHVSHSRMNADEVKQAQQKLADDGDYKGKVDGKFGSQTAQAVKQYQQKNGLKQTGRLDHDTRGKLGVGTTASGSSAPPAGNAGSGSSTSPAGTPNSGTGMPATSTPKGSL